MNTARLQYPFGIVLHPVTRLCPSWAFMQWTPPERSRSPEIDRIAVGDVARNEEFAHATNRIPLDLYINHTTVRTCVRAVSNPGAPRRQASSFRLRVRPRIDPAQPGGGATRPIERIPALECNQRAGMSGDFVWHAAMPSKRTRVWPVSVATLPVESRDASFSMPWPLLLGNNVTNSPGATTAFE